MGQPEIKYGDSMVVVQHAATGYWLSYQTFETKKRGVWPCVMYLYNRFLLLPYLF